MATLQAKADIHRLLEVRVADLARTPVEAARRAIAAEDALRKIETAAQKAIHEYSITQERPDKWVKICDLVLKLMAPIRDTARDGMRK